MRNYKLLIILTLITFFCVAAQTDCDKKKVLKNTNAKVENKNMNNEMPLETPLNEPNSEIKTLAEGSNAQMDKPFIFVARSAETYSQLSNLVEKLPPVSDIDFNKSAVVAAFAGEKNTGGYSVKIDGSMGNVSVKVNSPPPDAIVTEALTMPFLVSQVPVGEEQSLKVDLSENWTTAAESYKVTGGEFEYSGGFVGKQVKFEPKGTIKVFRHGDYATLHFDLEAKDKENLKTVDIASGKISGGDIKLPRLEAMSLIEQPHPPFVVSGTISDEKMSLSFGKGKRSFVVNDGFEGSGKLEAVKVN